MAEVLLKTKPRDRIHIIKHDKNHATGRVFYFGGARNLLPLAYERPAPKTQTKRAKTGKNREFLQKMAFFRQSRTTYDRIHTQIFGIFILSHTKIPCKNNREFFVTYQGIISE